MAKQYLNCKILIIIHVHVQGGANISSTDVNADLLS